MKVGDMETMRQEHQGCSPGPGEEARGITGGDPVDSGVQEVGAQPPLAQTPALLLIVLCDIREVTFPFLRQDIFLSVQWEHYYHDHYHHGAQSPGLSS